MCRSPPSSGASTRRATAPAIWRSARPASRPAAKPSQQLAPSAQKAVEERTPIEDEPTHALSPAELEVARTVHVGTMACELGASVTVTPLRHEGFFLVSTSKGLKFRTSRPSFSANRDAFTAGIDAGGRASMSAPNRSLTGR